MAASASKQHAHLLSLVQKMIPPLSPKLHKGQAGRIGVLGGSGDYSGAPYFSAMGALRFGADLAHVICEPGAGAVIKSYAPDLIVHGILDKSRSIADIKQDLKGIMERLRLCERLSYTFGTSPACVIEHQALSRAESDCQHVLVIGPGLGRDEHMQNCARAALELARGYDQMGVVVDADGLWLVQNDPSVVTGWKGVPRIILTPNVMEFKRLCDALQIDSQGPQETLCPQLARALENLTIIQKGPTDIISNGLPISEELLVDKGGKEILENDVEGGLKRVGGQGDILSGSTGVLMAWGSEWIRGTYAHVGHPPPKSKAIAENIPLLAAYGASTFNRTVSKRGFAERKRSMVTADLVNLVGPVYEELFGGAEGDEKGRLLSKQ